MFGKNGHLQEAPFGARRATTQMMAMRARRWVLQSPLASGCGPIARPRALAGRLCALFAVAVAGLFGTPVAQAAVTAVVSCNPCSSLTDLTTAATNWGNTKWTGAAGTVIVVTSLNAPISAYFKISAVCAKRCVPRATPVTASNAGAAALDNNTFARAAKLAPVTVPYPYTEDENVVIGWIENNMQYLPGQGINIWHALTGFPQVAWYTVKFPGQAAVQLYVGDTITVDYGNGYTEKYQFLGPEAGTLQFKKVPNTLMHNGKPVTTPTSSTGTPASGFGGFGAPDYWNLPGNLGATLDLHLCYGVSSVTVYLGEDSLTSWGTYIFPC